MAQALPQPRIGVWPSAPAQELGRVLAAALGGSVLTVEPHAAGTALLDGSVELALVPTLTILRAPEAYSLAPGAGLTSERSPTRVLALGGGLGSVETVAFDPRWGQEALLAQLLLREHYDIKPAFTPVRSDARAAELLATHGAALVAPEAELPDSAIRLDLGREWADLTACPMVWGLIASRYGAMSEETARIIAAATFAHSAASDDVQFSLAGLGYEGLEALADNLFYTGTLTAIPELPFVRVAVEEDAPDADMPEASGDGSAPLA